MLGSGDGNGGRHLVTVCLCSEDWVRVLVQWCLQSHMAVAAGPRILLYTYSPAYLPTLTSLSLSGMPVPSPHVPFLLCVEKSDAKVSHRRSK